MKPHLLVVEDQPHLCELYALEFAEEGFAVRCVSTAEEALAALKQATFDVMMVDLQLPLHSGFELLDTLNQSGARPCPVIICTAYSSYRDAPISKLADAYVVKSGDLTELKNTVRRVMHRA